MLYDLLKQAKVHIKNRFFHPERRKQPKRTLRNRKETARIALKKQLFDTGSTGNTIDIEKSSKRGKKWLPCLHPSQVGEERRRGWACRAPAAAAAADDGVPAAARPCDKVGKDEGNERGKERLDLFNSSVSWFSSGFRTAAYQKM